MDHQLTVSKNGDGNYSSITAAVNAVPYNTSAVIFIRNGVYREKLFLKKRNIILIGEDREKTVLTWQDGAYFAHPDGGKFGTFRSYTAYFGGERVVVKNMTIQNTAGSGDTAGQAIAVYADADFAGFENVRLIGRQDTLFLAPLPEAPRTPGSFVGPDENTPRRASKDYFEDCYISGDIDFIFGGAQAAFFNCTLYSENKNQPVNGYVTAASTPQGQKYGFIFYQCSLVSNCAPGTVYLGRPWREFAKVSFLKCSFDRHIASEGWSLWTPGSGEMNTVSFSEYANSGPGAAGSRVPWAKVLTDDQAEQYISEVRSLSKICNL